MTMKNRSEFTRQLLMDLGASAREIVLFISHPTSYSRISAVLCLDLLDTLGCVVYVHVSLHMKEALHSHSGTSSSVDRYGVHEEISEHPPREWGYCPSAVSLSL